MITVPSLDGRKLRSREVKLLAQEYTARKQLIVSRTRDQSQCSLQEPLWAWAFQMHKI